MITVISTLKAIVHNESQLGSLTVELSLSPHISSLAHLGETTSECWVKGIGMIVDIEEIRVCLMG